ncbi:NUDIX domain-containing protein [Amycolatopsis thermoflava]|uniref:NUDIX domain-containing protein n=1 Tax=Amycolatopsis thermoflava TaxID=84480 RepID=UPI003F49D8D7
MTSPDANFATPRIAAGALFVDGDRVLLVRKTYGNRWDIPGGYVDRGESPAAACRREIREEIGLEREPVRLLVQDWAPNEKEGDKILYVFSCGDLDSDEQAIQLDNDELDHWEWVPVEKLDEYVIPRLARRLSQAYRASTERTTLYLEHGEPALRAADGE